VGEFEGRAVAVGSLDGVGDGVGDEVGEEEGDAPGVGVVDAPAVGSADGVDSTPPPPKTGAMGLPLPPEHAVMDIVAPSTAMARISDPDDARNIRMSDT
jgi:hypothetical protein